MILFTTSFFGVPIIFMCFHMLWKIRIPSSIQTMSLRRHLCSQKSFSSTFLCHPLKRKMHLQLRLLMSLTERYNSFSNGEFISNFTPDCEVGILSPVIGQRNPWWVRGGLVKGKPFECVVLLLAVFAESFKLSCLGQAGHSCCTISACAHF